MAGTDNQTDPSKLPELPLSWIQDAELLEIPAGATRLLKDYSKISEDEILPHVNQVVSRNLENSIVIFKLMDTDSEIRR